MTSEHGDMTLVIGVCDRRHKCTETNLFSSCSAVHGTAYAGSSPLEKPSRAFGPYRVALHSAKPFCVIGEAHRTSLLCGQKRHSAQREEHSPTGDQTDVPASGIAADHMPQFQAHTCYFAQRSRKIAQVGPVAIRSCVLEHDCRILHSCGSSLAASVSGKG